MSSVRVRVGVRFRVRGLFMVTTMSVCGEGGPEVTGAAALVEARLLRGLAAAYEESERDLRFASALAASSLACRSTCDELIGGLGFRVLG